MSVSKLESLPNETLLYIFENYMNGTDVLNIFAVLSNRRFVELSTRCHHLRLDFIKCHKDSFCRSLDLLSNHVEQIEELYLGEENTPGQVHAFLLAFSLFTPFKQLTKLYLDLEESHVEWVLVREALQSLQTISLKRLSIKTKNALQQIPSLNDALVDLLRLRTLKQLILVVDFHQIQWNNLTAVSSNVERLTILSAQCGFEAFEYIFRCIPHLNYLHMGDVSPMYRTLYRPARGWNDGISSMVELRTLILECTRGDRGMFDMLEENFKRMPNLYRFKIITHTALYTADVWETLLTTSLPSLVYFDLHIIESDSQVNHITNKLTSFQTLFWIEKRNFNIMVIRYASTASKQIGLMTGEPHSLPHVVQWWLAPFRGDDDNFSPLKSITSLSLSVASKPLQRYYYFENVKELVINDLDNDLFEWIPKHINYSRVTRLDISMLRKETINLYSLLSRLTNISTLRMRLQQLLTYCDRSRRENTFLKDLDISSDRHNFERTDIDIVSKLFPNLEQLSINTQSLYNVPMLKSYLPRLRSLTFVVDDDHQLPSNNANKRMRSDCPQSENVQFWIKRKKASMTVWLDWTPFEPYWSTGDH